MRRGKQAGFTLLELLVVVAIIGVVTTMGAMMFGELLRVWRVLETRAELDQQAQNALNTIGKDLAATIPPSLAELSIEGFQRPDNPEGLADMISFPIRLPTADGPTLSGSVSYHVRVIEEEGKVGETLVRQMALLGDATSIPEPVTIAEGVVALAIEYLPGKGAEWQTEWSQEDLPEAVRVSITLTDADNPAGPEVARKAIFPIKVD